MATFVSLVTCHHCPVASPRRGLVYADSLSILSRRLPGGPQWPPGGPQWPPGPRLLYRHPCRLNRCNPPESFAVAGSSPSGGVRHLLAAHLKKLLPLSPTHHRRGLRLLG